jgi:hypothetical protein
LSQQCSDHHKRRANAPLFESFFLAGFECSDHRLEDGRRLDMLESTRHVELAGADYARVRELGISASREGVSWVRAEPRCGEFDFTSLETRLAAARQGNVVVWDLMHFGWPDHVDVFAPSFPACLARYAAALVRWLTDHGCDAGSSMFCPINEMSFLAWAGGDVGFMNPFAVARGVELKAQLVLAAIAAIDAIRELWPEARFLHCEPAIQIVPSVEHPQTWRRVECDNQLQHQALDMLTGRVWPRLGGAPHYLDIVGVNFYPDNQFMLDGTTIRLGDPRYKPLQRILLEVGARYGRPMILSETGAEGQARAPWLRYVVRECLAALEQGCDLHGVTLYPILNHPGWVDGRHCHNGLWDYADAHRQRAIHEPLAEELRRHTPALLAARACMLRRFTCVERTDHA